ncbi:rhodanese domain-containing protein CG4456-like [Oratosquilla oratoria]|uniref:rhodanese domain-containing protein CG4456-like n=1 Tax=Oratosquilla oratoria TaxID=337810 RepID=UPI003F770C33
MNIFVVSEISFEELQARLHRVVVLDVRRREEIQENGGLPGAHCIPVQELEDALDMPDKEFLRKYSFPKPRPEDPNIVLTCRSGNRVRKANDILLPKGFNKHRLYLGSFLEWQAKGGDIVFG